MKKLLYTSVIMMMLMFMTSCGAKDMKIKLGTYQIKGTDSQIVLGENNTVTVHNYDLSELEKKNYENYLIAIENDKLGEGSSIGKEEEQKIRKNIDLNAQFLDKKNTYSQETEEDHIGIYVQVNNCDLFFYAQFFPSDNTVIFDGKIFNLVED